MSEQLIRVGYCLSDPEGQSGALASNGKTARLFSALHFGR
jgi:hypothetical protein